MSMKVRRKSAKRRNKKRYKSAIQAQKGAIKKRYKGAIKKRYKGAIKSGMAAYAVIPQYHEILIRNHDLIIILSAIDYSSRIHSGR